MSIAPELFRAALSRYASGITIITTHDADGADHGMTVSAFASLSLTPPLVMFALANDATMAPVAAVMESFAVNVLRESQELLSRRFSGKLDDRFEGLGRVRGTLGDVLLDGVLTTMQCRVTARYPAGDHVIVVGEVESAAVYDGDPLLYFRGGYVGLER